MKVLAFDPGADRMGYAVVESGPKEVIPKSGVILGSNIVSLPKLDDETYQEHRLRIIKHWSDQAQLLITYFKPDFIANEIVPPTGGTGGNIVHRQKAMAAITTVQVVAIQNHINIQQFAASTVKKAIGGKGTATKVAVRNGVIELLPSTERFKDQWKKVFDQSDAFAVGLTALGYKIEKGTK